MILEWRTNDLREKKTINNYSDTIFIQKTKLIQTLRYILTYLDSLFASTLYLFILPTSKKWLTKINL